MKKFFSTLLNVLWVLTGGLVSAIECILLGIGSICLIIPIFVGIPKIYFTAVPLVFAPFGKKVVLHFGDAPIRNVLWLIFGGFITFISEYMIGLIFCCTIVGIPLGLQVFKFAKFYIAPFKAEVVKA